MTDNEIFEIVKRAGGTPVRVKRWRDGQIDCIIRKVSIEKLGQISDVCHPFGITVCQPW